MGLLDRFRKEEHVHFTRDEKGEVVKVDREYTDGRGQKIQGPSVSKQLIDKAKLEKKLERKKWKEEQRKAYREEFEKARLQRMKELGKRAGRTTVGDRLSNFAGNYNVRQNYNPFGNLFDTGLSKPKTTRKKGSSGKTHYAIVGGKAYPIAKTVSKKKKGKKKKGKSKSFGMSGFDPMDNWGLMK